MSQVVMESAVRQVTRDKPGKKLVCKDLVIWPDGVHSVFDAQFQAVHTPLLIHEWKCRKNNRPGLYVDDLDWLCRFTAQFPDVMGLATTLYRHQDQWQMRGAWVRHGEQEAPFEAGEAKMNHYSGDEQFFGEAAPSVLDFWRWAFSDLTNNTIRGVLAEFLVAHAAGVLDGVRDPWATYDLTTKKGLKLEVKSSGYLQSWRDTPGRQVSFTIAKSRIFDTEAGKYVGEPKRHADSYVFAMHMERDPKRLNPLDLSAWWFWVVPTQQLDALGDQKTMSLSRVQQLGGEGLSWVRLREVVGGM